MADRSYNDRALDHVASYSIFNDGSIRDYQFKSVATHWSNCPVAPYGLPSPEPSRAEPAAWLNLPIHRSRRRNVTFIQRGNGLLQGSAGALSVAGPHLAQIEM
jgi:2-keto-4-pentenoate hydratase/2-oxohepta-3-ene-1,7-dioic acid hydratase in catechol pathway